MRVICVGIYSYNAYIIIFVGTIYYIQKNGVLTLFKIYFYKFKHAVKWVPIYGGARDFSVSCCYAVEMITLR